LYASDSLTERLYESPMSTKAVKVAGLLLAACAGLIALRAWVFPPGQFNFVNLSLLRVGMSREEAVSLLGPPKVELPIDRAPRVLVSDPSHPTGEKPVVRGNTFLEWRKSELQIGQEYLIAGLEGGVVVDIYHWEPSL
jgi:hypothetical protein